MTTASANSSRGASPLPRTPEKGRSINGPAPKMAPFISAKHERLRFSNRPKRIMRHVIAAVLVLSTILLYLSHGQRHVRRNLRDLEKARETFFLAKWADHVNSHPVRARDYSGFAEMGLRTRMYAHLLKDPSLPNFDTFEEVLWPFIPGIKSLRESYMNGTRTPPGHQRRGIVISVGGNGFVFVSQFLSLLRNVWGSSIPVELYYYGDEDLPANMRAYLTKTFSHVRTVDIERLGLFDPGQTQLALSGWALKPFALLATNFTEVILADADAVFLTKPDDLFRVDGFKETGTLFFHDRDHWRDGASQIIHDWMAEQLRRRPPSQRLEQSAFWQKKGIFEQESGVVVVDKSRLEVFSALLFSAWMNTGEVRDKTTYRVFWGDKETFWLAFELAELPYHFSYHYAGAIGNEHATHEKGFCAEHPLHFIADAEQQGNGTTPKGRPAWFNGSLLDVKSKSRDVYLNATAWAIQGEWEFMDASESWCIRNYTAGSMQDFGLDKLLVRLIDTAKQAEKVATAAMQGR